MVDRAAAEADHARRGVLEHGEHELRLALAEARFALAREELADRLPGLLGEQRVGVDEGHAEARGDERPTVLLPVAMKPLRTSGRAERAAEHRDMGMYVARRRDEARGERRRGALRGAREAAGKEEQGRRRARRCGRDRPRGAAVDGAANEELVRFVAKVLGIRQRDIELVRGETSREKLLSITGLTAAEIESRLRAAFTT